jgi:hypothetical protein
MIQKFSLLRDRLCTPYVHIQHLWNESESNHQMLVKEQPDTHVSNLVSE